MEQQLALGAGCNWIRRAEAHSSSWQIPISSSGLQSFDDESFLFATVNNEKKNIFDGFGLLQRMPQSTVLSRLRLLFYRGDETCLIVDQYHEKKF